MQTYVVNLTSDISKSFRCQKAANSLDIDVDKKSKHEFKIDANIEDDFTIGLIVGASGSEKTTLAKQMFGQNCFKEYLDLNKSILDQFPSELSYEDCQSSLSGVGLTSVPCWIRPAYTLSNGQKSRAEMALAIHHSDKIIVIDEFTSVVDRTVAKVMSHSLQKFARKNQKKIVLLACHYDVIDWVNPDWIIDCNKQEFIDRRSLWQTYKRQELLQFDIKEIDKSSWKYFSKYHYLSDKLPGGKLYLYGLFHNENQVGFQCFANYVPKRENEKWIYHSNRTVIHPDYAGLGLGILLINETSKIMSQKDNIRVMAKFSSTPIFKAMSKQSCWKLVYISRHLKSIGGSSSNKNFMRNKVKTYSFEYIGNCNG